MYSQCVQPLGRGEPAPNYGIYQVLDAGAERYFVVMGGGEGILEAWFDPRCRIAPGGGADQQDGGHVETCALPFSAHLARRSIRRRGITIQFSWIGLTFFQRFDQIAN